MNTVSNIKFRSAVPGIEARLPGRTERLVGSNGHINATSKQDLSKTLAALANAVSSGDITLSRHAELSTAEKKEVVAKTNASFKDAYERAKAGDSRPWAEVGAAIAGELTEVADRAGFMRRMFHRVEVAQGNIPRIRVRAKSTSAIAASSATQYYPIQARDKYLYPPEFYIKANIRVEEREIAQATGDILEDKYFEAQEQMMRKEDQIWKTLADSYVGISNSLQYLAGGLTPSSLSNMVQQVQRWNLIAYNFVMANDVIQDITGSVAFGSWFDPVSQYEIVQTGKIGTLLGLNLITDAYREPRLKVLNAGETYVTATPDTHGAFTERGPIQSVPVDSFQEGNPARGWSMWELTAMVLHNSRSLSKGIRS